MLERKNQIVYITVPSFTKMRMCSICGRPSNGYYRTNANRIYCDACWRDERNRVLRYRDEAMRTYKQEEQQYRILEEKISMLRSKISSEQNKREEYQNSYYIKQLQEELRLLFVEKSSIGAFGMGIDGPRFPRIDNDIMTAKYFESEAAEYIFLEEKRKAEEDERKRVEEARKAEKARQLQMRKEKEAVVLNERKRIIYENEQAVINGLSSYNGRSLNLNDYMLLAYRSMNENVLKKLMQSKDIQILNALLKNPSVSQEMQQEIMRREIKTKQEKEREKVKKEEKKKNGCLSVLMIVFFSSFIITMSFCLL